MQVEKWERTNYSIFIQWKLVSVFKCFDTSKFFRKKTEIHPPLSFEHVCPRLIHCRPKLKIFSSIDSCGKVRTTNVMHFILFLLFPFVLMFNDSVWFLIQSPHIDVWLSTMACTTLCFEWLRNYTYTLCSVSDVRTEL